MVQVMIVRELDDTLSQVAASLELSREETARILLESALIAEVTRS